MSIVDRLLGRMPEPELRDDRDDVSLERLIAAEVRAVNVRYDFPEPVTVDLEVESDWGPITIRDIALADPTGEQRVAGPWVMRPYEVGPNGKRRGGWAEAVEIPDALRQHVRTILLELWTRRE